MERSFDLSTWPGLGREVICTLGNFDGFHLGHQAVLDRLCEWGEALELPTVVVTFDPHPAHVIRPKAQRQVLVPMPDRLRILEGMGVDGAVVLTFDARLRATPAEAFFMSVLYERLQVRHLVLGPDSRFGKDRAGDLALCQRLGAPLGVSVDQVDPVVVDGARVSSSLIRETVLGGALHQVPEFLGRRYRVRGKVVKGRGKGADLGFPTANVDPGQGMLPADGVYGGRLWSGGRSFPAAISVGSTPTFGVSPRILEAHVLDFTGTLYDQIVSIEFHSRLRPQERFFSEDELSAQIDRDVDAVRQLLSA